MARVNHKKVKQMLEETRKKIPTVNSSLPAFLRGTMKIWRLHRRDGISTTAVSK